MPPPPTAPPPRRQYINPQPTGPARFHRGLASAWTHVSHRRRDRRFRFDMLVVLVDQCSLNRAASGCSFCRRRWVERELGMELHLDVCHQVDAPLRRVAVTQRERLISRVIGVGSG
jgi:hypothetical protein